MLQNFNSQKGFAHFLMIVLLILGVALGVYILQKQTNLFSKAGPGVTVEFINQNGVAITTTTTTAVMVKLTSPDWNSSSGVFGIKQAYAQIAASIAPAPPPRTNANQVPAPPEKVTAAAVPCNSANDKSPVKITWVQPQTQLRPALFYKIERTVKGTDWTVVGYTVANPSVLEFTDVNASKNTWFAYRVSAAGTKTNPGYGSPSNSNWVLTNNCQVPPPIATPTPTPTPTQSPSITPKPSASISQPIIVRTVNVLVSEDPNFTNFKSIGWNTDATSMVIDHTFSTSYPGLKTLYVRFKDSNGAVKDGNPFPAVITLQAVSSTTQ